MKNSLRDRRKKTRSGLFGALLALPLAYPQSTALAANTAPTNLPTVEAENNGNKSEDKSSGTESKGNESKGGENESGTRNSESKDSNGKSGGEKSPAKTAAANGGVASPIQSTARPLGLSIASPVMRAGSDTASAEFQQKVLPAVTSLVNTRLSERQAVNDSAMLLDPSKLTLKTDSDVRVYFVGEGAGYHNSLGFNTTGAGVASGNPKLIFPDASSAVSMYDPAANAARTASTPLLPGDFANLGSMVGGTKLNFFLVADGANGGKNVYSTDKSANPDGINHVVSFVYAVPGSSYLLVGFEDLYGGGDRDFNDVIMAVDIGAANIAALTGTPEPAFGLTLGSLVAGTVWIKRRRDRAAAASSGLST